MAKDLREWIRTLQAAGGLHEIDKSVNTERDIGGLIYQSDRPILFNNVEGHPNWRVLGQPVASMRDVALSLGVRPEDAVRRYAELLAEGPGEVVEVADGPVHERVLLGEDADVTKIPVHVMSAGDGGKYIGSGLCVTRDPETGVQNMAFHRMQIKGPHITGIQARTENHLWKAYEKYEEKGQAMPISIVIGHHPMLLYAAAWSGSAAVSEYAVAARLMGEPMEVVRCKTNDLQVPAWAEIVIEGEVPPGYREIEGPFGEFQGYATAAQGMNPVIKIKAITMRTDAIYASVTAIRVPYSGLNMAALMYNHLKNICGGIDLRSVYVAPELFAVYIQMAPRYAGEAKNALMGALTSPYLHPKIAYAVDPDVDLFDSRDILWAVATRVNPRDDVFIVDGTRGHPYDVSLPEIGTPGARNWQRIGSKMGIDATKPAMRPDPDRHKEFDRARPPGWGEVFLRDFLPSGDR